MIGRSRDHDITADLIAKKTLTKIFIKYANFADVFFF